MNQQALGNLDVAEVFCDLCRAVHRPSDERDFAAMVRRQLNCQFDAMDGRRKTRNEKTASRAREYFIKFSSHRSLTWSIALAFDVGGVLKQRQHSFFPIFGESVQVKQLVVSGCRIDLEIASMKNHSQRRVHGQRNTIHQTVRHLDGMNRKRPDLETFSRTDFAQISGIEQAMLF